MNKIAVVLSAASLLLSVPVRAKDAPAKGGASATFVPASDIKWADAGMAGVQIAPAQGDPSKGPAHFFLKLAAGFAAPLHHHTANHFVTVVSGTLVLTVDGGEHKLPAGSYFSFTGMKQHKTACEAGADCVLSMDARGKWDVVPEEAAKPAAAK